MNKTFQGKHGPLLIAEIGGNHEGNFEYAKHLTELAIETDVDFIKFQLYTGNTLVSKIESPVRNKHFKKFELSKEQHIELAKMVTNAGIGYMASVWDIHMIDWIDPYIQIYKIGSGDVTAYPVIQKIVGMQKPIILSSGISTEDEILETVNYIQELDPNYKSPEQLSLLQCTSMYPINTEDANLAVMKTLAQKTNLQVGYSDHTEGKKALFYAAAMGAQILEFHFTDSREGKEFRDHKVSLTPQDVKELIDEIKLINRLKGQAKKKPLQIELENDHHISFRRAVYPQRDIKKGEVLSTENLCTLRPSVGIDAREFAKLIGKKTTRELKMHEKLSWKDIEPA